MSSTVVTVSPEGDAHGGRFHPHAPEGRWHPPCRGRECTAPMEALLPNQARGCDGGPQSLRGHAGSVEWALRPRCLAGRPRGRKGRLRPAGVNLGDIEDAKQAESES